VREEPPRVSVVVPAYNAGRTLGAALASVQMQTEHRLEVLVIDDASTDDTALLAAAAAASDPRVRTLRNAANSGPAATRNRGFAAARGAWVALLDADDAFRPERLAGLLALGDAQAADMVADNLLLQMEGSGGPAPAMIPRHLLARASLLSASEFVERNIGDRRTPRMSYGFLKPMIRRDFLLANRLAYDERNRFGEDFLLYLSCLVAGARWWITPEPTYVYTIRRGSLTEVQTAADLDRIRTAEHRLLQDPRITADRHLRHALRRHKRKIDRSYFYRAFTDALKARRFGQAAATALGSPANAAHIAREAMVQAPAIVAKALRGGYRRPRGAIHGGGP
jgi:glycosyltransferase involved in cell wall biosynthesis